MKIGFKNMWIDQLMHNAGPITEKDLLILILRPLEASNKKKLFQETRLKFNFLGNKLFKYTILYMVGPARNWDGDGVQETAVAHKRDIGFFILIPQNLVHIFKLWKMKKNEERAFFWS